MPIWQHVLAHFYPSLIPSISIVIHQDYHHPLLPFIHVAQEFLSDYFEIVETKADDSAAFRLIERIPERVLSDAARYDFSAKEEIRLMDRAIERMAGNNRHLKVAKAQLHRMHGDLKASRDLLEDVKQDLPKASDDPYLEAYIGFVEIPLLRDEIAGAVPPADFDEELYLQRHPDVRGAVARGQLASGYHHWIAYGMREGREWR